MKKLVFLLIPLGFLFGIFFDTAYAQNTKETIKPSVSEVQQANTEIGINKDKQQTTLVSNQVYFYDTNDNPSPLERYAKTTSVHPLRRADILLFISIPFTLLWTDFLIQRLRDFSVMSAFFEGGRGGNLRVSNFSYNHENFPTRVTDPFYLFKWTNGILWPLVIVANDFLERTHDPKEWEKEKKAMKENRFNLNLINHNYH